ncbi:GNAT family N-acetyltransferase [Streptomyces xanthochromogenes]|uniref:GNAT family N-acetyltransferase n=1 Tax=Streptomyces xanthochromogenes TaxID=67384 RepID=UPI0034429281
MTGMTGMTETLRVAGTAATGGLVLRPWRADDVETVIEAYGDPEISRWTARPIKGAEDARCWLDIQRRGRENGTRLSFAVCAAPEAHAEQAVHADRSGRSGQSGQSGRGDQLGSLEGLVLGNVSLRWTDASGPGSAEVGYWVMAHARGQGVAPRAVEALSRWSFATFADDGLRRIELIHQVDNLASCRVAAKSGYLFERLLPAEPPYPRDGHLHVREAD